MKKFLFSIMAFTLCIGLIGSAFAYFSDTETSTGNLFTAGTLNLTVDGLDGVAVPKLFNISTPPGMAPGDSGSDSVTLANTGTINGTAALTILNLVNLENGVNEPETEAGDTGDPGELGTYLFVTVTYDGNVVASDTIENLVAGGAFNLGDLNPGPGKVLQIDWTLPGATDNTVQSDSVTFDLQFTLNQAP